MRKILIWLLLVSPAFGQAWSGILDPARAVDWTNTGIPGGIPSGSWTKCGSTIASGASTATIQSALNSCGANQFVLLGAGTFTLSTSIAVNKSNVVLRGSGPNSTTVNLNGHNILMGNGSNGQGSLPAGLTSTTMSTLAKGSTVLTLGSVSGLSVGQIVAVTEQNAAWVNPNGNEGNEQSMWCTSPLGWTGCSGDSAGEYVEITNVNSGANQITVSAPGLMNNYSAGLNPLVISWSTTGVYNHDGVESMTVTAANAADFGLAFVFCNYCWVKNVTYTQPSRTAFYSLFSYRDEFRDSYIGGAVIGGGPTQYAIEVDRSQSTKIENNIIYDMATPIQIESSSGIVSGYNYILRTVPNDNVFASIDTHRSHVFQSLFEANIGAQQGYDFIWGSASHNTTFRNYFTGTEPGNPINFRYPYVAMAYNRYINMVGNVLGDTSFATIYECTLAHNSNGNDHIIYDLGWFINCINGSTANYDPLVESSMVRWGNWDAVSYNASGATHKGTHYCTGSGSGTTGTDAFNTNCLGSETANADPTFPGLAAPSTTIPASFYTGATAHASCGTGLSFWKNPSSGFCPPYPPIGPDNVCSTNCNINSGSHASMIPAQLCYNNTTKDGNGFLTNFDATACYANDPAGSVQAATPTFSPVAGSFTVGQLVTPSTTSSGAFVCVTIDGTTPTSDGVTCTHGFLFTTELSIGSTTTVKALAAGSGYTNSTVATATFTINPFNADNLYCPTGTPTWGTVDGPATLPQTCYNTAIANTPATGSVVNVTTAGQLTTALAAAACGQIITLQAGNTFSGTGFTIPALSCPANNYLWIVSSGMSSLPVEGARYSTTYNGTTIYAPEFGPCYSGVTSQLGRAPLFCPSTPGTYTAKIVTTNTNPALTFTTGTSGVRLIGLEFARTDGTGFVAQLIKVGNVGTIDHVIFDRLYCHGNEDLDETSSCINMSAVSNIAVIDSYMPNFFCAAGVGHNSCDAHALWGGGNNINTTPEHTVKVVNNWLEGAAETIEIGGVAANVVPTDFEVRNNMMFKPLQWNPADPSYDGGLAGGQQIVKNLYEHKTGQRVLVEGNYFINNWAQAQDGTAILLVAKNQTGNLCPICAVEDITFRYNYISTASAPFGLVPTSATDGQLFAAQNDLSVHDNVADNMMYPNCYNCGTPTSGAFQIESIYTINTPARVYRNLTINHNTVVHSSTAVLTFYASVWVGGPTIASGLNNTNLVFKNNVFMGGSSGVLNTPGNGHPTNCGEGLAGANTLLTACYSPIVFTNNCILAHGSVTWPTGQLFVASQTAAYANYNNGDNGDYTIAAGACKGAATDGSDPGANLPTLASVLIGNNPVSRQDIPATYFGLHWKIANFPPLVPSGSVRLWDSLTRWQLLNPSNGVYTFTDLDTNLLDAKNINVDVLFALSTTPNFISSDPTNATCNYNSTANGGCGVPTDIAISCTNVNGNHNCDGKTDGALQSWDLFIYNTLLHIQGLDPNVYQVPSSYEIWNEFTQQGTSGAGTCNQVGGTSWEGTCAQLALLYSHANCIITGRGVGCTAGAMGTPAVGLYPNAIVTTPDSVMTAPQSTQWGAYLGTAGALTNADVAAVHAYTQGGSCCALPETVVTRYTTASGLLANAGGTQPIWSTEGGWGQSVSEPDVDLQAAFVARYYLLGWNAGFKRLYWYSYDSLFGTLWTSGGGLTKAGVAYGQIYGWMVGSVFTTPCAAVGTVYSCVLTNSTGDHLVMWDTSQTCSGGVCTTSNQPVASTWLAYQDMTTQSIPIAIAASHQVPIGAKPVIFQQSIITHGAGVNPVILGMNRGPK